MVTLHKGDDKSFTSWVKGCFSHRGKALSLYRSGMAKSRKRDYDGAIADYSAAIRASNIPKDVKAMAIYNRALAYSANHEDAKATEDLAVVLKMPGVPSKIRTYAQQRREWIQRRDEKKAERAAKQERG